MNYVNNYNKFTRWVLREITKIVIFSAILSFGLSIILNSLYLYHMLYISISRILIVLCVFLLYIKKKDIQNIKKYNYPIVIILSIDAALIVPTKYILLLYMLFEMAVFFLLIVHYIVFINNIYKRVKYTAAIIFFVALCYVFFRGNTINTLGWRIVALLCALLVFYMDFLEYEELNTNKYSDYDFEAIIVRYDFLGCVFWILVLAFRVLVLES